MAFKFINEHKARCSVSLLCRKFGVSRSGYYTWCNRAESKREIENLELLERIRTIHEDSRETYGSPRVHAMLQKEGTHCNIKRVARLMRINGIQAKMKAKFKKQSNVYSLGKFSKNLLLKQKSPEVKNQIWVGDVTYIRVGKNWSYLAVVMDLYTRRIIGWSFSKSRTKQIVNDAIRMAIESQKPKTKLIFHSDQGIEYFATDFRAILKENKIIQSMSHRGCCWDNAYMESFFHSLKTEMVYFQNFKHLEQAVAYIIDYITFYNDKRIHSGLDYLTPKEFEKWVA